MNYKYLIDANVLSTGKVKAIIETEFFRSNCIVLDEIAYELMDTSIGQTLKQIAKTPDVKVIDKLRDIADDLVTLSILKTDQGNGDALLIAAALSMKDESGGQAVLPLMREQPVIVTDEKLVDAYAKKKGLDVINGTEFMDIIEAALT